MTATVTYDNVNNNTKQFQNKNNSTHIFDPVKYEEERKNRVIKSLYLCRPPHIPDEEWEKRQFPRIFNNKSDLIAHIKWVAGGAYLKLEDYEWLSSSLGMEFYRWYTKSLMDPANPEYKNDNKYVKYALRMPDDLCGRSPLVIRIEDPDATDGKQKFLYWGSFAKGANFILNIIIPRLTPNASIHEVMIDELNHQRSAYIDIDCDPTKTGIQSEGEFVTLICGIIKKYVAAFEHKYVDCRIYRSYCPNNTKFSAHVIFDNITFDSGASINAFFVGKIEPHLNRVENESVDKGIYKTFQSMRMFGQSKGGKREKILATCIKGDIEDIEELYYDGQIDASLSDMDNKYIALLESLVTYRKPNAIRIKYKSIQNVTPAATISDEDINDILTEYAVYIGRNHQYRNHVAVGPNIVINFDRINTAYCEICERHHDNENFMYWMKYQNGNISKHCRRNPDKHICIIGSNNVVNIPYIELAEKAAKFRPHDYKPASDRQYLAPKLTEIDSPALPEYNFDHTLVVVSQMGTGKSQNLRPCIARAARVLIVSFRKTFTREFQRQFKEFNFLSYLEAKDNRELREAPKVIVQYESIHKIEFCKYDLVVLDELEQILNSIPNTVQDNNMTKIPNWRTFMSLLNDPDNKVIVLDATFGARSDWLLQSKRGQYEMLVNHYKPHTESKMNVYENIRDFNTRIMTALEQGQKVAIPISSLSKGKLLEEKIKMKFPHLNVLFINGDNSDKKYIQEIINDVDAHFVKYDVLMYTSTISAGVSFVQKHFDVLFAHFDAGIGDGTTPTQMLGRIRDISTKEYNIYVDGAQHDKHSDTRNGLIDEFYASISRAHEDGYDGDAPKLANIVGMDTEGDRNRIIKDRYAYKGDYHEYTMAQKVHMTSSRNNFLGYILYYAGLSGMQITPIPISPEFADKHSIESTDYKASKKAAKITIQTKTEEELAQLVADVLPDIDSLEPISADLSNHIDIAQQLINDINTKINNRAISLDPAEDKSTILLLERISDLGYCNQPLTSDLVKPHKLIKQHNRLLSSNTSLTDYYKNKYTRFIENSNIARQKATSKTEKSIIDVDTTNSLYWYKRERISLDILQMCGVDINAPTFISAFAAFPRTTQSTIMTKINDPVTGLKNYISNEPLFAAACNKRKSSLIFGKEITYIRFSKFINPILESTLGIRMIRLAFTRSANEDCEIRFTIPLIEDNTVIIRGNRLRHRYSYEVIRYHSNIFAITQDNLDTLVKFDDTIEVYDELNHLFIEL
jgi:hypothetical protein